jgi:hypothetical protein
MRGYVVVLGSAQLGFGKVLVPPSVVLNALLRRHRMLAVLAVSVVQGQLEANIASIRSIREARGVF